MTAEQEKLGITIDAESMSFDNIINAISVMQEHLNIAGTTSKEAAGTIEGSVNSMKAAWKNFLAGTLSGGEFAEVALQAADNVVNALLDIVPRLISGFAEMTPALLDKAVDIAGKLISSLSQGIAEGIPKIVEKGMQMLTNLTNFLSSDGGTQMINSGLKLIENLVRGLANSLPVLVSYIPQIILGIVNTIANNLPQIIQTGVNLIESLIVGILNCVPKLIEQFPNIIRSIINLWKATNWFSLGTYLITAILNGISQLISAIPNLLRSIGSSTVSAFRSIDWYSLGSNIINGIINGLRNGVGAIMDAARNVAQSALNAAKSFLGIHSPSRVFRDQVGYQMDAGQAIGIEENADLVEDAAKEVSQKALDASMNVNYDLPSTDSVSREIGASFSSRVAQTVNRVIEVPLSISGREIARATAWDMGEQLAWESR